MSVLGALRPRRPEDAGDLADFLQGVDLTTSGITGGAARTRIARDDAGTVVASTGYELRTDGRHALLRSVAVDPALRSAGIGTRLARAALEGAAADGARTARGGPAGDPSGPSVHRHRAARAGGRLVAAAQRPMSAAAISR